MTIYSIIMTNDHHIIASKFRSFTHTPQHSVLGPYSPAFPNLSLTSIVADPDPNPDPTDPHVFVPPGFGSGSISQRNESGSG